MLKLFYKTNSNHTQIIPVHDKQYSYNNINLSQLFPGILEYFEKSVAYSLYNASLLEIACH
jgi:hypothetical protein